MKRTKLSMLAAAGGICLFPISALHAADTDTDTGINEPAEVIAKETMRLSIVVAKGGG